VKNSKDHYSARCNYCTKSYNHGVPQKLLAHLANHCISCDSQTSKKCLAKLNNKTKTNLQKNPNVTLDG
ncbi:5678_t:CDS:2, partial [Entrophospora sp. SA101]